MSNMNILMRGHHSIGGLVSKLNKISEDTKHIDPKHRTEMNFQFCPKLHHKICMYTKLQNIHQIIK